jgi:hypothetical protein
MTRQRELDSVRLYEAIEAEVAAYQAGARPGKPQDAKMSLRKACEQAGVSPNTTTRLKAGTKVEADILLALLDWLGVRAVRRFMRPVGATGEEREAG